MLSIPLVLGYRPIKRSMRVQILKLMGTAIFQETRDYVRGFSINDVRKMLTVDSDYLTIPLSRLMVS